jgi:poly-gamma-glutamate synthesis protein (capsule biosynthesis protein)
MIIVLIVILAAVTSGSAMRKKPALLVAGGDVMFDRGVRKRMERDGGPVALLSGIAPLLREADVGMANLECPLTERTTAILKRFSFRCDPAIARALKDAGFTAMTLANNHTCDYGREGLMDTARFLEAEGIIALGAGEDRARAAAPRYVESKGIVIALLGFTDMQPEGLMPMPDLPGPALAYPAWVEEEIRKARGRADVVVVNIHWGAEYEHRPTPRQRVLAARMAQAGADLVVGHHPHVIQSIEMIGDTAVFYSVGNLVFDHARPECMEALMVRMSVGKNRDRTIEAVPVRIIGCRPRPAASQEAEEIMERVASYSPSVQFAPGERGFRLMESPGAGPAGN